MANRNYTLLLTITAGLILLVFLLTATHGNYSCKVDGKHDEVNNCAAIGITKSEEEICKGNSFIIHIDLTDEEVDIVRIVCPWSTQSLAVILVGALIALLYTIFTILQRRDKSVLRGKYLLSIGLAGLGILGSSIVFMIFDVIQSRGVCKAFLKEVQYNKKDCSIAIFILTFLFVIICLGFIVYEIFLGYKKYKEDAVDREAEAEGVYISKGDLSKVFKEEDTHSF